MDKRVIYGKIVRNNIPAFIKIDGQRPEYETVSPREALHLLKLKLEEEAREARNAEPEHLAEELVDIVEVVLEIARLSGIERDELERQREKKLLERGGFSHRIKLIAIFPS